MKRVLILYAAAAALCALAVFLLAFYEKKQPKCRLVLLVLYVFALLSVILGTGLLEGKYRMSRLYSTLIALAALGLIYAADSLGGRFGRPE